MKRSMDAEETTSSDAGTSPADHFSRQLEVLAEMGRDFASTLDIDAALVRAVEMITGFVDAAAGALFLLDETGRRLTCHASVGATEITGLVLDADQGIVGRSVQRNEGIIVRDVAEDPDFYRGVDEQTGFTTRSILCAPMSVKNERLGAIELINKRHGDGLFSKADLLFLGALSSSAALAILNARMAEKLVEQERVRRELELAAEIQRSLLPEPGGPDFPLVGLNRPARVVSGDFYDFFELSDGRIAFSVGDVSGKGLNAALMMAKTASLLRCLGKSVPDPGRLLQLVNAEICETATRGMFVTLVAGIYDPASGHVRLANAGHEPPLVQTIDGGFRSIPAAAPPLGISPALAETDHLEIDEFPETAFDLEGGVLFVFTDGITEGYVAPGEELGVDGFKAAVSGREPASVSVAGKLTALADRIAGSGEPLRDDLTVLAIDDGLARHVETAGRDDTRTESEQHGDLVMTLRVPAAADRLKLIRRSIEEATRLIGAGEEEACDIVLAVDEACQNIVRHAYGGRGDGDIAIELRRLPDCLVLLLRDFADPIDTGQVKPRPLDELRPGGLGTHFMREVMDEVKFLPTPFGGGNLLRMVKRIDG